MIRLLTFTIVIATSLLLCACGGSKTSNVSPTPSIIEPDWVAGQFSNASTYKDLCSTPRTTPDSNGDTFLDAQGTSMHEKMWLRSWTNDTYLWYSEVEDNDPSLYSVVDYFKQLKTNESTSSASLKDNFHFSQSTEDYNKRTQSGVTSGYGISWESISSKSPRRIIVRYTEPNSPAAIAGVKRGHEILTIDGIDFINSTVEAEVDIINAALYPSETGQSFNFVFSDEADNQVLDAQLTSANIELQPVQNVKVIETAVGRMGYMQFNSFIRIGQQGLIDGFQQFIDNNVTELVIDLRYNGGGLLAMASQLAYMIAGPSQTNNQTFETLRFNDKHPRFDPITGQSIEPTPFHTREINWTSNQFINNTLPSLDLTRVFILATDNTCSASEAVINGLRGIDVEVVLIGDTTCGKPFGFYAQDNCSTTYFTIQFQGVNAKGFGEYSDGFKPVSSPIFDDQLSGCTIIDDFSQPLGDENEALFAAAMRYAETGTCPIQNNSANNRALIKNQKGIAINTPNQFLESNKILTPISEPSAL
ncbi:S41 family peptidase [uncultured Paraglaciecola sp.]|uniref:S41 family peptidase n=1 Tax=uncultured Paraglaciecola sp. TaxID=1765024 RepID=UPI002628EEC5|nr:S41 family peptidase [uncultured Paraglaciecola sp.]